MYALHCPGDPKGYLKKIQPVSENHVKPEKKKMRDVAIQKMKNKIKDKMPVWLL
jgi:hypothetical protein